MDVGIWCRFRVSDLSVSGLVVTRLVSCKGSTRSKRAVWVYGTAEFKVAWGGLQGFGFRHPGLGFEKGFTHICWCTSRGTGVSMFLVSGVFGSGLKFASPKGS